MQAPDESRNEHPTYQLAVKVARARHRSRRGLRRRALDRSRLHGCDALGGGVEGAGGGRDNAAEVEVLTEMTSTPLWRRSGRGSQGSQGKADRL